MFEICIRSASGHEIVDTIVNHSCFIGFLYKLKGQLEARAGNLRHYSIKKIYGPPSKQTTPGTTLEEIADVPKNPISERIIGLWSGQLMSATMALYMSLCGQSGDTVSCRHKHMCLLLCDHGGAP